MDRAKESREGNGRRNSLGQDDWLNAALESLNEKGIDAVKVLPLSHKLGVTRGSFYWHFKDREDLLRQMLEYWERELTDVVIVAAMKISPVREKFSCSGTLCGEIIRLSNETKYPERGNLR